MSSGRKKQRIAKQPPFKSKIRHFLIDHYKKLFIALLVVLITVFYFLSFDAYWKNEYNKGGVGYELGK